MKKKNLIFCKRCKFETTWIDNGLCYHCFHRTIHQIFRFFAEGYTELIDIFAGSLKLLKNTFSLKSQNHKKNRINENSGTRYEKEKI